MNLAESAAAVVDRKDQNDPSVESHGEDALSQESIPSGVRRYAIDHYARGAFRHVRGSPWRPLERGATLTRTRSPPSRCTRNPSGPMHQWRSGVRPSGRSFVAVSPADPANPGRGAWTVHDRRRVVVSLVGNDHPEGVEHGRRILRLARHGEHHGYDYVRIRFPLGPLRSPLGFRAKRSNVAFHWSRMTALCTRMHAFRFMAQGSASPHGLSVSAEA